jgi:uncharacterized membrane protein
MAQSLVSGGPEELRQEKVQQAINKKNTRRISDQTEAEAIKVFILFSNSLARFVFFSLKSHFNEQ